MARHNGGRALLDTSERPKFRAAVDYLRQSHSTTEVAKLLGYELPEHLDTALRRPRERDLQLAEREVKRVLRSKNRRYIPVVSLAAEVQRKTNPVRAALREATAPPEPPTLEAKMAKREKMGAPAETVLKLSNTLRALREEAGWTNPQIAKQLHYSSPSSGGTFARGARRGMQKNRAILAWFLKERVEAYLVSAGFLPGPDSFVPGPDLPTDSLDSVTQKTLGVKKVRSHEEFLRVYEAIAPALRAKVQPVEEVPPESSQTTRPEREVIVEQEEVPGLGTVTHYSSSPSAAAEDRQSTDPFRLDPVRRRAWELLQEIERSRDSVPKPFRGPYSEWADRVVQLIETLEVE